MFKIVMFAMAVGIPIATASPFPDALAPAIPGALTTTHHTSTAAHHPVGLYGMGYGAYPGVVKHTETVSSAGYPAAAALNPYAAYGAYPGLTGLGFGTYGAYPAAKQVTQVTTTAMRPGLFGYY